MIREYVRTETITKLGITFVGHIDRCSKDDGESYFLEIEYGYINNKYSRSMPYRVEAKMLEMAEGALEAING